MHTGAIFLSEPRQALETKNVPRFPRNTSGSAEKDCMKRANPSFKVSVSQFNSRVQKATYLR